jgi:hypothetical protein
VTVEIDASCAAVFGLIHDYDRRLDWDTMLKEARLLGGASSAGIGVRSLCTGTWRSGFLALETEYIRFEPGRLAAVRLVNRPPFFENFAASIRHEAIDDGRSRTVYVYSFRSRPRLLAPLLEPVMDLLLQRETRNRLRSLRSYLESGQTAAKHS